MISTTSLNAQSALNKGHQIPMSLENGRLRVDSQKFLVPSLPVSARGVGVHHNVDPKRRERSIINGTAHPASPADYSHHHHTLSHVYQNSMNGFRPSYNHNPHGGGAGGGRDNSPNSPHNSNSNRTSSSPHHPYLHLSKSPRKDAHSPMYGGEVPGQMSPGGNYSPRSSMPIPCSSPAQASSASPKGSSHNTHSPSYSPKLPSGPAMLPPPPTASELNRLYPGFPPPHPSVAAHLSPAFYAAAAAAHSLPYPIFGPHYNPHSHSAAAARSYLDSFHSALVNRSQNSERSRSPSPSPPTNHSHGVYHSAQPHPQQQSHNSHHGQHQSTSVSSLHNKLIESIAVSSDRHHYNGHHHHAHNHQVSSGQFSPPQLGISKGGPLGISGGIMNLPSTRMSSGVSKHSGQVAENLIVHKQAGAGAGNGYHLPSKQWMEHHGLNHNDPLNRKLLAEIEANEARQIQSHQMKEHKHHSPPQDMSPSISHSPKIGKSISFASDTYPPTHPNHNHNRFPPNPNSNFHHPYANINGHNVHHSVQHSNGILTDSNHAKKQMHNSQLPPNNSHLLHLPHQISQPQQQQQQQFHPPSPKKRTQQWNFAVPANPTSKMDLPPPPPPPPLNHSNHNHAEHYKYLNSNQNLNHNKPSNQQHSLPVPINSANSSYLISGQSAHSYPSSPRSGPSTPKSPSVHQVKFSFSNGGSSKENLYGKNGNKFMGRNDSSSSVSSNEGNVPWPVEQMPLLEAFRRGSLIELANGDLRPVEDLKAEDFSQAVASMPGTLKIIHCTVLAIQQSSDVNNGMCKVTMTTQRQKQQVVVPSTPEQPFFVMGRGWSSLSPKTTEKLLQLPCYPLAVGDVCITLSKTGATNNVSNSATGKSQQIPKSPRGRKPGSKNSPTVKKPPPTPISAKRVGGDNQKPILLSNESIKRPSMGPPLTTTVPSSPTTNAKSSKEIPSAEEVDSLRPSSPKRRRWSAPEPEISVVPPTEAADDADKLIKEDKPPTTTTVPDRTNSLIPVPEKDEHSLTESDRKTSDCPQIDLNSNISVKDSVGANINEEQRRPPDAQSAKA